MEIPEERQATALSKVARIGAERAELLARAEELMASLENATIEAVKTGAPRTRTRTLAQVSPATFYSWLETAGLETRPKKTARKKSA
ncbi:hypothetical protein QZH56_36745 [Streptomyces olivoreticuli]|uniref:hypothetical protein n=1 Tax=Streptomyces olivoreticuli TaxID=68246 RepID=UPI002657ECDC|nr:hypothetical protein [Streptomyces olivoreticuli]WKK24127.1 hypothetical protein QZH56_36745 [Streptomyces olivoreticuli]